MGMSQRLIQLLNDVVLREGARGKARLSMAAGRGEKMIDRYRNGESVPPADVVHSLALACGCSDREALALAREGLPSNKAKTRTA